MASDDTIRPFRIDVPAADLADLRDRLARTRWPDQIPGSGWAYGVDLGRVRQLADYWREGYDWPAQQARLNELPQFTTTIDGQNVHFLHVRSPAPDAVPLLMTHGWPGGITEFTGLVGPLTRPAEHGGGPAFHLVIPSIPGYGFSGPTTEPGWDVARVARAWAELMRRLGYERYGAHGGDWGARIAPELARIEPDRVLGLHVNAYVTIPPPDLDSLGDLTPGEKDRLELSRRWFTERSGYAQIQSTRPQTLAYGLVDSPVGLLAWNTEWYDDYGDAVGSIDADTILTVVMLYWLTGTAGSAARIYREAASSWGAAEVSPVPTGIAVFPGDGTIRRLAERQQRVVRWTEYDRGGHFAALQAPDLLLGDIREFFAGLR
jgi:pimeloyl-ACP methyl ester carboxylesterase